MPSPNKAPYIRVAAIAHIGKLAYATGFTAPILSMCKRPASTVNK